MQPDASEVTYRFAAFAARGTVTLGSSSVRVKTWTHLGWWEQTLPLSQLSPHYGTLNIVPGVFVWACILAILGACLGLYGLVWGTATYPQKLLSALLLGGGVVLGFYLLRHRKCEWVIFQACGECSRVGYTRQGPDADICDEFTERLVGAIRASKGKQSESSHLNARA